MLDVCWIVWTSYKLGADLAEEWTLLAPILPRLLNSRLALTRLAILNTWNNNTKTEVASRNNVVHESVLTPRILQRMPMPMVERHVQACLNFSLSFCLCVRAVAWRHSDSNVSIASSSLCIACDVTNCNAGSVPVTENYNYTIYRP